MPSDTSPAYQQEQASAEQAYERFQLALQKLEAAFLASPAPVPVALEEDAEALKAEAQELRHAMNAMQAANHEALQAVNAAIILLETMRKEAVA